MIEPGEHDYPLTVEVKDGKLTISIGIERLAFCFENSDDNIPYDSENQDFLKQYEVVDQVEFAHDVGGMMLAELGEDGSTLLSDLFDTACFKAVCDGCLGVKDTRLSS